VCGGLLWVPLSKSWHVFAPGQASTWAPGQASTWVRKEEQALGLQVVMQQSGCVSNVITYYVASSAGIWHAMAASTTMRRCCR
jgi:hypothetical protein